jgi:subfamily B ATP-binding cassette protein MsbA
MALYLRILKYVRPYWAHLLGSLFCILLFTIFSSAMVVSVIPFLRTIFYTQAQTVAIDQAPQPAPPEGIAQPNAELLPGRFQHQRAQLTQKLNDLFMGNNPRSSLLRVSVIIVLIIFFKGLFGYLQSYFMAYVEQGVIRDLRNDLYRHLHALSLSFFNRAASGEVISRVINDVTLMNNGISASFVTLVKNPLLILASLAIAFYLSWQLTLAALLILPLSLVVIGSLGLRLRRQSVVSQEKIADVTSVLQETVSGIRVVKAFGMERFEIDKFGRATQRHFRSLLRMTRVRNLASPLTEFLGTLVGVGILWFGGTQVLKGDILAPEEFIAFLLVIFSVMQPVKELSSVNNRIQEALGAAQRFFELLDTEPDVRNPANPRRLREFRDCIRFDGVAFCYEREEILQDIDLVVRKGQIVAIVGPSGAGKSTLVDLIPRFYDPTAGRITIDGIDLREVDLGDLRSLLGIVTQETILFNDTVFHNIAYGLTGTSAEEVVAAARMANAHRFILELPQGYDTVIGERGVRLSGGQRQRIAIARALLKNPPILILDEATSALDTESEMLVQQAIERLMENRTSLVIAHRLSTILHADRIVVLDRGRIVQEGTHEELVAQPGIYRKLYRLQFRA